MSVRLVDSDIVQDKRQEEVKQFTLRSIKKRQEQELIYSFHVRMMAQGAPIPYGAFDKHVYVTVYTENHEDIDVDATNKKIATVVQAATKFGYPVIYKHDDDYFNVIIKLDDEEYGVKVIYQANRSAVCERKVVGKKRRVVTEDIVEYDCKKVSFLAMQV